VNLFGPSDLWSKNSSVAHANRFSLVGGGNSRDGKQRSGYVKGMTRSSKRDAIDQLEYEDLVLPRLLRAMGDENRDRPTHGRIVKLFVERMAVRQAARELVGDALVRVPQLSEFGARLQAPVPAERAALDHLDDMTRGIAPNNVNQSQDVDSAVSEAAPRLLEEIREDLSELIPSVHRCMDTELRRKALPSASYVLRHCPLHPGAHERRRIDHIGPLVWLHAVYDYLRSVPVGGVKPKALVTIPGEGPVPIDGAPGSS
jgi:hypothetical protein